MKYIPKNILAKASKIFFVTTFRCSVSTIWKETFLPIGFLVFSIILIIDAAVNVNNFKLLGILYEHKNEHYTKNEESIKDFFSKCDQIGSFLRIWSHLWWRNNAKLLLQPKYRVLYLHAFTGEILSGKLYFVCIQKRWRTGICRFFINQQSHTFDWLIPIKCMYLQFSIKQIWRFCFNELVQSNAAI